MHYQALYRKYRPQRFDEVIGQDHVTSTLAREVIEEKVAHAYLLAGPRGTGKTTTARLLAKSLNCANPSEDAEPDNECPSCIAITEGTSLDVIELDAASNNKVEDVREIRIKAGTVAAAEGARRVYILDEAHMLTRAAGNALLKILEEPPEHVIFVLATTEPYKLLDTIRSRAQRFDFHPVATETLISYLDDISTKEGFTADRSALEAVTSHSEGSVRDAMSLLEQVAALGRGDVTASGVSKALGLADRDVFDRFITVIAEGDPARGLALISELATQGADLRRFVADAIGHMRGVFLAQYASNIDEIVDASAETIAEWKQQATVLPSNEVLRTIEELSAALLQLRDGREERLVVELAVIRLTNPETVPTLDGVQARLERVERELRALQTTDHGPRTTDSAPVAEVGAADRPFVAGDDRSQKSEVRAEAEEEARDPKSEIRPEAPAEDLRPAEEPAGDDGSRKPDDGAKAESQAETPTAAVSAVSFDAFEKAWPVMMAEIRQDVGPRRQALLREASPRSVDGAVVVFEVAAHMHFHLEQLKADAEIAAAISSAATKHLGSPVQVVFRSADAPPPVVEADPERAPDKDDLLEASADAVDPVAVVVDILDGKVIE
jgi:DNA polymerase-3 subunit gamma/tau